MKPSKVVITIQTTRDYNRAILAMFKLSELSGNEQECISLVQEYYDVHTNSLTMWNEVLDVYPQYVDEVKSLIADADKIYREMGTALRKLARAQTKGQ